MFRSILRTILLLICVFNICISIQADQGLNNFSASDEEKNLSNDMGFDSKNTLVISEVSPKMGHIHGGTKLTITGENLPSDAKVLVDEVECKVLKSNNLHIECITGKKKAVARHSIKVLSASDEVLLEETETLFYYYQNWDEVTTWEEGIPKEGEDVLISENQVIMINVPKLNIGILKIEGILVFQDLPEMEISVESVILNGGKIIIGSEEVAHENDLTFIIRGDEREGNDIYQESVICIDCEMQIHGKQTQGTILSKSIFVGDTSVEVEDASLFKENQEILISSPSSKVSEKVFIYKISDKNLLFKEPLRNKYLVENRLSSDQVRVKPITQNIVFQNSRNINDDNKNTMILTQHKNPKKNLKLIFSNFKIETIDKDLFSRNFSSPISTRKVVKTALRGRPRILAIETTPRNWNTGSSWNSGSVPTGGDVLIESTWNMMLNTNTPTLDKLTIEGRLTFDGSVADLELHAKVIIVEENGELIIGEENTPYPQSARIVLHGANSDTGEASGTGIPVVKNGILNKGLIKIYGDHSRFTEARLTEGIVAGNTILKVDSDVHGWQIGDQIVIPSSMTDASQVELGTIASISGNEITLTSAVTNTHKEYLDYQVDSRSIEVGTILVNLTKKIVIESNDNTFGCVLLNPGYTAPSTIQGNLHIEDVEFKNCGQSANNLYAVSFWGNGNPSNDSVLKRVSLNNVLGKGVGIFMSNKVKVQESTIYSFKDSGVEIIAPSTDVDIDGNNIIKVTTVKVPVPGSTIEFNYGILYTDIENTLEDNQSWIRNNRISSIGTLGIGLMVPGDRCTNNFTDPTAYHFQGNLVHSSDVGWASLRNFPDSSPMECQKFSHFKAYKIKLLALGYYGTSPHTIFEEIVITDSQYSMMNFIEPLANSTTDRKVVVRNSAFVGRTFHTDASLYIGRYDCETNGITTPLFTTTPLAANPIFLGVDVPAYVETNYPGKQIFKNVTFKQFKADSYCTTNHSLESYSLRINEAYQNGPVSIYLTNTKFEEVDIGNKLLFPNQARNTNTAVYCGSNDCDGISNSVIFDSDGSFANDGIPRIYYGDDQNLSSDASCVIDTVSTNTYRCPANYGQIYVEGSTQVDGDLFPLVITANESLTGGTVTPFSNTIDAGVAGGGQSKLREVNTMTFANTLSKNVTLTMTAGNTQDWAIFKIDAGAKGTLDVYKDGAKVERYASETISVESLMLFAGVCGKNIFERSTNSLYIMMNGTEACSVEVRPVNAIASSLKIDTTNADFLANDGVNKVRTFLYAGAGLDPSTNRINVGMIRPGSTIVEFEIESDNMSDPADTQMNNLETIYCLINTKVLTDQAVDSWTTVDGLGLDTVLINGASNDYYLPACNTNPHDKVVCTQWSDDTTECMVCGDGFTKNTTTKTCDPNFCTTVNATTGQCSQCNTNYWRDTAFYNVCKPVTSVTGCATYEPTQDQCATCNTGSFLTGNNCTVSTIVSQCQEYSSNGVCSLCNDGYGVDGGSCTAGTITQCQTYSTLSTCTACNTGFFLENSTTCTAYTSDLQCNNFEPAMDKCVDCNAGFRLVTSGFCEADSACIGRATNGVDCSVCASTHYLDPTHTVCRLRTAQNCDELVTNADQCQTCQTLHWMDASDSNQCKPVTTVDNCATYEVNSDQCKTCEPGRILTGNTCPYEVVVVTDCEVYQTFGICQTCADNHYLYNNECNQISIAGCTTQTSPTECSACDSSNFLNGTTCSVYTSSLNCKDFNPNANECLNCPDYYLFNTTTKTCSEITSCETFDTNKVDCTVCKSGFVLNATTKQCEPRTAQNCLTVLANADQCDQCNPDSYKDTSDGNKCKVTTVVANCSTYQTTQNACDKCVAGYFLDGGNCTDAGATIDYCQFYTNATTCNSCNDGYYLNNNTCPKGQILGCIRYTSATSCSSCESGFYFSGNTCFRYASDLNCAVFSPSSDACESCPDYYKIDGNNKCVAVENCKTFDTDKTNCTECQPDFYLPVSGVCTARTAENCTSTFVDRDQCSACALNYWLNASDSNKCVPITPVQYCNTYKTTVDECAVCVSGKYLESGSNCASIINEVPNCNFYEGNGDCEICEDGFFLNGNQCDLGTINGCKVYELQTKCKECNTNYYLNSTFQCAGYTSDLNCKTFSSSSNECTECEPYNTLNSEKKCVPLVGCDVYGPGLQICSVCNPGYYLDQLTNLCVLRTRQNCATTQPNKDECMTCNTGYYMDASDSNICKAVTTVGKCSEYSTTSDTCVTCNAQNFLNQNSCTSVTNTINNCSIYQSATVCRTCNDGYLLSGGSCITGNVNNCKTYITVDQCYECLTGYYRNGSFGCTAYTADLNCKTFDPVNDKCIDCNDEYTLVNSTSCKRLEGCQELESNPAECKVCKSEYLIDSTTKECIKRTASNCGTYNATEDKCNTCAVGFYLNTSNSTCANRTVFKSCQGFEESEDKCTICSSGFYLINGSCKSLSNPIVKCAEYSADGICLTCESSYSLKAGNTECIKNLENCKTSDNNGQCTECDTGYYLKDPTQCVIYSFHPNCTKLDPTSDKCLECTDFHKLNSSNVCVELSRCQEFEDDNKTCKTCKLAYALNKDTKECESERPERCHTWDPANNVCEECHSPYKLEDNECVEDTMSVGRILLIFFLVLFILLCLILLILLCLRCCMKKEEPAPYGNEDASIDTFQSPNIEYKEPTQQSSDMVPTPAPIIPLNSGPMKSEIKKKQFSYNPRVFDEESGGFKSNEYGTTQSREFATDDKFKMLSTQGGSNRNAFDTEDITKSNNILKSEMTSKDQNSWRIPEEDEHKGSPKNPRF